MDQRRFGVLRGKHGREGLERGVIIDGLRLPCMWDFHGFSNLPGDWIRRIPMKHQTVKDVLSKNRVIPSHGTPYGASNTCGF